MKFLYFLCLTKVSSLPYTIGATGSPLVKRRSGATLNEKNPRRKGYATGSPLVKRRSGASPFDEGSGENSDKNDDPVVNIDEIYGVVGTTGSPLVKRRSGASPFDESPNESSGENSGENSDKNDDPVVNIDEIYGVEGTSTGVSGSPLVKRRSGATLKEKSV